MKILNFILFLTFLEFLYVQRAEGQPSFFEPFHVYVGMQTGAYILEELQPREFSPHALPVDWLTLRNNPPAFVDYSIFLQYEDRRFVSRAESVTHIPQSVTDVSQPTPHKTYVHLNKGLWLHSESFGIFTVSHQQGHDHYNRIFITLPGTHTVYTAQLTTISTPKPPQPKPKPRPHITQPNVRVCYPGSFVF